MGKRWHSSDKGFLEKLAKDARSGKYFAMGEFEARHYASDTNNYVSSGGASLETDWKKVIEEFPDRFVVGSDINTGRFGEYNRVFDTYRDVILKGVRKDVAGKIAFKNAWKLMTGVDWKD
jgi:hypothetical protein